MKKILGLILASLLLLLAGCGSAGAGAAATQTAAATKQATPTERVATIDENLLPAGHGDMEATDTSGNDAAAAGTTDGHEQAGTSAGGSTTTSGGGASGQAKTSGKTGQSANATAKPTAKPTEKPAEANDNQIAVTISIDCRTAVAAGYGVSPASGVILSAQSVRVEKGSTVWDVLNKITRSKGIPVVKRGSGSGLYVSSINSLGEFDCGSGSGWMYNVNGVYPMVSCGAYTVKAGDSIQWRYTTNLGKDLGQEWVGG